MQLTALFRLRPLDAARLAIRRLAGTPRSTQRSVAALVALTLAAPIARPSSAPRAAVQEPRLVFVGGRIFDGVTDEPRANLGLVLGGGKIQSVDREPTRDQLEGAEVIELGDDELLVPGFFDLHAHYAVDLFEKGRVDERVGLPLLYLANGVTSTFPAGEVNPDEMRDLRLRLDSGEQTGPRLFNSGPYFGRWRKGWNRRITEEELRAEVDHWAAQGVTCFKAKSISPEHLRWLIDQAHRHGLGVTGHLDSGWRSSVNPRDAIEMGIDRIEHFLGGDQMPATRSAYDSLVELDPADEAFARISALFIERGVHFDATLSAFGYYGERDPEVFTPWVDERSFLTPFVRDFIGDRPPRPPMELFERIYWAKRATLRAFFAHGGGHLITVGTDHPSWGDYLQAFGYHRELHCFALAGLPTAAILKAATINGARALGLGDRLGTLEAGKWADCVVLAASPFEDIRNTRRARLIVRSGRLYAVEELLAAARDTIGPRAEDELNEW